MTCPSCHVEVKAGWKACPECGQSLSPELNCPVCHEPVQAKWKACPNCGASLAAPGGVSNDGGVMKAGGDVVGGNKLSGDFRHAGGANVGGGIHVIVGAHSPGEAELEYEEFVFTILELGAGLEAARSRLDGKRQRLKLSRRAAGEIEGACVQSWREHNAASDRGRTAQMPSTTTAAPPAASGVSSQSLKPNEGLAAAPSAEPSTKGSRAARQVEPASPPDAAPRRPLFDGLPASELEARKTLYREILELEPRLKGARGLLGAAMFTQGDLDQSLPHLTDGLAAMTNSALKLEVETMQKKARAHAD